VLLFGGDRVEVPWEFALGAVALWLQWLQRRGFGGLVLEHVVLCCCCCEWTLQWL
jgi:hypothetical protein